MTYTRFCAHFARNARFVYWDVKCLEQNMQKHMKFKLVYVVHRKVYVRCRRRADPSPRGVLLREGGRERERVCVCVIDCNMAEQMSLHLQGLCRNMSDYESRQKA
jgi:hypothetical protein